MLNIAESAAKAAYIATAIIAVCWLAFKCLGIESLVWGFAAFTLALIPLGLALNLATPLFFAAGFIIAALVSALSALPPAIRSALRRPTPTAH